MISGRLIMVLTLSVLVRASYQDPAKQDDNEQQQLDEQQKLLDSQIINWTVHAENSKSGTSLEDARSKRLVGEVQVKQFLQPTDQNLADVRPRQTKAK